MESKRRVVQAEGLACPRCNGPIDFITPYIGKDEYDLEKQLVGAWTWWILVPFAEIFSGIRALTGNSPGAVKKLYNCSQCVLDLSYKEATKGDA